MQQGIDTSRQMLDHAEQVELSRLRGIADALLEGSKIYAGMALKATSSVLDVASLAIQEG